MKTMNKRDFLIKAGVGATATAAAISAPLCARQEKTDKMAITNLCRGIPGRACNQAIYRCIQQGSQWRNDY